MTGNRGKSWQVQAIRLIQAARSIQEKIQTDRQTEGETDSNRRETNMTMHDKYSKTYKHVKI